MERYNHPTYSGYHMTYYHDIPSVTLHDVLTLSDPADFHSYANIEIIKLPQEMPPLICSNHFSLEFQEVIAQFHILKRGRLKEYLAQSGSGISRISYFTQATGDLVSKPHLSMVGFALNFWKQRARGNLKITWSHPLLLLMRKLNFRDSHWFTLLIRDTARVRLQSFASCLGSLSPWPSCMKTATSSLL